MTVTSSARSRLPLRGALPVLAMIATLLLASAAAARLPAGTDTGRLPAEAVEQCIAPLLHDGSRMLQRERLDGLTAPDTLFSIVLMCDFADSLLLGRHGQVPGDFPPPMQTEIWYAAHDSLFFDHKFQDVRSYFETASRGRFHFAFTVHPTVANLPHPMVWYGNHPDDGERPVELAADVVAALDEGIDFSGYDTVILVHAGSGQETDILGDSPEQIYSSYLSPEDFAAAVEEERLTDPWIVTDDLDTVGEPVRLDQFLILPETEYQDNSAGAGTFSCLGVYCFEVGLRLGMLSLSDFTPSGRPDSQGIGEFGLMGYGLFVAGGLIPDLPCAFNRMLMGWVDPYGASVDVDATCRLYPAADAVADSTVARVEISPSEYWLLEYRLQDPDGNRIFSFPGDVNGDGVPNFFAIADSTFQPDWRSDVFDPELHIKETLSGGEWDFFMSDNDARAEGVKGAGSGIYIWHVDELTLREAFQADSNLYNADPHRKSIDLEEADGIQDLDSRRGSLWFLGGDDDSYRAENTAVFGPDTSPSTVTAGGAPTGIVIDGISNVVEEAASGEADNIRYTAWMEFDLRREATVDAPTSTAVRRLPGVDLKGSHLVAADLVPGDDGALEIVVAADMGRVLAFGSDLQDMLEGMPEPGLLAVGTDADGAPVAWNGPPALAAVAGNGRTQVVLTAPDGLYLFNGDDGSEVLDGDANPASSGLALPLMGCDQPAVVDEAGVVHVVEYRESGTVLRSWPGGGTTVLPEADVDVVAPPFLVGGRPAVLCADRAGGVWFLQVDGAASAVVLDQEPNGLRPLVEERFLIIPTVVGGGMALDNTTGFPRSAWRCAVPLETPPAAGLAFGGGGRFAVTGSSGSPRTGWPQAPRYGVTEPAPARAPGALVYRLAGTLFTVFTARDGRHYLYDEAGGLAHGWPVAGPGESAGTPLLMDLDGVPGLELLSSGSFERIIGVGSAGLAGEPVSELRVWSLPHTEGAEEIWPMWGGGPGRGVELSGPTGEPVPSRLLADNGALCYPQPVTGGTLHVRVLAVRPCRVVATLYNFEGELVRTGDGIAVRASEPGEILFDLDRIAAGVYLCRLSATDGTRSETTVLQVAVSR